MYPDCYFSIPPLNTERWGSVTFGFLHNFGILAFCAILLPTIWFTLNCVFLSAWGMGMYTLREAVTPASINMQQVDMSKVKITKPVDGKDGVCPSSKIFLHTFLRLAFHILWIH